MLVFIARRLFVSLWVFLAATAVMFILAVHAKDPLAEARQLPDSQREGVIAAITERMNLDKPILVRYVMWLGDAITGDLGTTKTGQSVNAMLGDRFAATFQLLAAATVLAIVVGISVGVISALRQYSMLDQTVTFVAFICFSLPLFWVGTLLKQYAAIEMNNWLQDPEIPILIIGLISLIVGLFCGSLVIGDTRSRLTVFGVSTAGTAALFAILSATHWFADPGLGLVVIALSAFVGAIGFTTLVSGLDWKAPPMRAALTAAGIGVVCSVAFGPVLEDPTIWTIFGLLIVTVAVCAAVGWFLGGELFRRSAIPAAVMTGVFTGGVIFTDRMLQAFAGYSDNSRINGRPIATFGSETPNIEGTFWDIGLDKFTHLLLPTLTLVLLSLAVYTRYTRASMLEVMNQDYVRTARAKGLPERAVITRHALRNGMIPITTLAAYDVGSLIGGAVITETVFGFEAMGKLLFDDGISQGDPMPIMAFFLVSGGAIVVFNMIADILYGFLDPRIRLS